MENITWLGHASFSFIDKKSGNRIYYVDPFHLLKLELEKADLIFITHAHSDHLSPQDISLLLKPDTTVIATEDSLSTLQITQEKVTVKVNMEYTIKGFNFKTVPAYNIHPDKLKFHPKDKGWVGYVFDINGLKIYHAGDTDFIPEMENLKVLNLDIAMIPMGGKFTMGVEEAVTAANIIGAKMTIPMHYKALLGENTPAAEEELKKGVVDSEVVIMEEFK